MAIDECVIFIPTFLVNHITVTEQVHNILATRKISVILLQFYMNGKF